MGVYWSLLVIPLIAVVSPVKINNIFRSFTSVVFTLYLAITIGGRDHVGCDWNTYDEMFFYSQFAEYFVGADVGYTLVNRLFYELGFQVYSVNILCGTIFAIGMVSFALRQPNPPLTVALAAPYLIMIVSMGYTRQATAIGILMVAFGAFQDGALKRYLLLVALAAAFHKTAAVFALLALFMNSEKRLSRIFIVGIVLFVLFFYLLLDQIDYFLNGYVELSMESDGGIYRVAWNIFAALCFFILRRKWRSKYTDQRLYFSLAMAVLICAPAFSYAPAAIDRMNVYFLPFQIGVFARLPEFASNMFWKIPLTLAVISVYAASMYVWLYFASHASCWVPYSSIIF